MTTGSMGDFLDIVITERRREADGVISLRFARPNGAALPLWEPGAHIELRLPSGRVRQYSLCGRQPGDFRIAVLDQPLGRGGSLEVHQLGLPGSVWAARGPRNQFGLVEADDYLLIAGGIGITPLIAMINKLAASGRTWRLVYGGRTRSSMAFVDELEASSNAEVLPQDEFGLLDLETLLKSAGPRTAVYCCGPAPMITSVLDLATTHLVSGASLHTERFSAREPVDNAPSLSEVPEGVRVILERSNQEVIVAAGQTILEAVRSVVPGAPSSCEEGFCGTCETRVLRGIPEHHDDFLTDEERESGETMMICVGGSLTPELTLDL